MIEIQSDPHQLMPKFEMSKKALTCSLSDEDEYVQHELVRLIPNLPLDSLIIGWTCRAHIYVKKCTFY